MNEKIYRCLKQITERLKQQYQAEQVILFGSYAQGNATEESDIDLFIIAPAQERFFQRMATVRSLIRDLRNGLPISPLVLTEEEVEQRVRIGDQFVQTILAEGMRL